MEGGVMIVMTEFKKRIRITSLNNGVNRFRSFLKNSDSERRSELFLCCCAENKVHGIYRNGSLRAQNVMLPSEQQTVSLEMLKKCTSILLLPKSHYLVKVLEVPKVVPEEVPAMLRLEVEAQVPPEYGCVEISYRELLSGREGYNKYEVYIARRETLDQKLSELAKYGLEPQTILPTAVAWAALSQLQDRADFYVTFEDKSHLEVTAFYADGSLAIRTISLASGLERELSDFIRPFLIHSSSGPNPLKVGWIGNDCPFHMNNDRVIFTDLTYLIRSEESDVTEIADNTLEQLCSRILYHYKDQRTLHTGNLLPNEKVVQQVQRAVYKRFISAAMVFLFSLLVIYSSLKVAIFRYQRFSSQLSNNISLIKTEGEEVGRRIDQLRAIQNARLTSDDFYDVLAGLYNTTPQNAITYSQVELTDQGMILHRGQAESLSQPFALPEKMEKEPVFEEVLLRDAGQSKRGDGSVTEFRIDCKLKRMKSR